MMTRLLTLLLLIVSVARPAWPNEFYSHGSYPTTGSAATSAGLRAELDLISAGFDKLPALAGNANKAVIVNGSATGLSLTTGTFALGGNFAITGAFATTLAATADTSLILPTTGTLATLAGAESFSNKSLSSPVLVGTVTGTYILGGTPTLTSPAISNPVFSGTATGAYTLAGTPTLSSPTINGSFAGSAVLGVAQGGLGSSAVPSNGQLPIGNGNGYTAATLTPGSGVLIGNASGQITLWSQCTQHLVGLTGANNAGTPNTKYDLSADAVSLHDGNGACAVRFNTGTLTNDLGLTGSAANGRDQAGAFTASSWVHLYLIWNGTTLATLSSATAPPTGPNLPSGAGYTYWAYAGAVYFDGASHLIKTRLRGSWAWYETEQSALSAGSATTETAISLTTLVPPNALAAKVNYEATVAGTAGGTTTERINFRLISGSGYYTVPLRTQAASQATDTGAELTFPNIGQNLFYLFSTGANTSTRACSVGVTAYQQPNGGE